MNYGCEVLLGCDIGDNANPWDETDREGSHNTYSHPSDRRLGNPWHGLLGTGVLSLLNGPQQSAKVKGQNHCFGPMSHFFFPGSWGVGSLTVISRRNVVLSAVHSGNPSFPYT